MISFSRTDTRIVKRMLFMNMSSSWIECDLLNVLVFVLCYSFHEAIAPIELSFERRQDLLCIANARLFATFGRTLSGTSSYGVVQTTTLIRVVVSLIGRSLKMRTPHRIA